MILLIQYTLLFASVLMLVALGGCFSEHSGVINLGLEGIMVMGALGGALVMKYLPAGTAAIVIVLSVILASMLMGLIYSALLGVAGVNFSADQTLVGTAMNMLAAALATVIVKSINVAENPDNVSSTVQYGPVRTGQKSADRQCRRLPVQLVHAGSCDPARRVSLYPLQDALRTAPYGVRRTPCGSRLRRYQR